MHQRGGASGESKGKRASERTRERERDRFVVAAVWMSLSHKSRRYLLARRRQQQRRPRSSCPSSCRALITLRSVRADEREREKTTPSWSVYTVGSWSRPRYKSWLYSASDVIFRREWGRRGGCRLEVWFLFPARARERAELFSFRARAARDSSRSSMNGAVLLLLCCFAHTPFLILRCCSICWLCFFPTAVRAARILFIAHSSFMWIIAMASRSVLDDLLDAGSVIIMSLMLRLVRYEVREFRWIWFLI